MPVLDNSGTATATRHSDLLISGAESRLAHADGLDLTTATTIASVSVRAVVKHPQVRSRGWDPDNQIAIVIGLMGGTAVLAGVLYVYWLWVLHLLIKRQQNKRKRRARMDSRPPNMPPMPTRQTDPPATPAE